MAQPKKEIIINAREALTRVAILEDGDLVELFLENQENERTIGNIYLGRIRRIMPSIRAAFVDIGQKQDAFLHFSDLSEHLQQQLAFVDMKDPHVEDVAAQQQNDEGSKKGKRRRPKHSKGKKGGNNNKKKGTQGNAEKRGRRRSAQRRSQKKGRGGRRRDRSQYKHLKQGQKILVKITKEPISNKGSRISTDISMAGRFLVLVPFGDYVAVSKKITSQKERKRLRTLAKSLLPDGFGVIIRTVAEGRNAKALDTDLRLLLEKWRKIESKLQGSPRAPKLVHEDVNMVSSVMRDLFSSDYDRVLIDDDRLYRNIRSYIQAVAPQMVDAVQLHEGSQRVFERAGISKDVEAAFNSRVELPSGGYLFIEHTEAMHVVDVNSGRSGRGMSQEQSSLKCNLEAARVITRQMRLRDLGGIIVVDFIDLRSQKNRKKVYDELQKQFKKDRAVTKVLPMSDFGVVQITRQRLRPSITTTFAGPNAGLPPEKQTKQEPRESPQARPREKPQPEPKRQQEEQPSRADKQPSRAEKKPSDGRAQAEARNRKAARSEEHAQQKRSSKPSRQRSKQNGRPQHEQKAPAEAPGAEELVQAMEQWITDYRAQGNRHAVTLQVHPFTAAYLNRKVPNYPTRWFIKHLVRVRLESSDEIAPTSFRFLDTASGENVTGQVTQKAAA